MNPAIYDFSMGWLERSRLTPWRVQAMARLREALGPDGFRLLDVGVGTGANFGLYPDEASVTAIDADPAMLGRAQERLGAARRQVELRKMNVMALDIPDASFDAALTTLVFCEVADPLAGLREIRRVLKPGAPLVMLEHTVSGHAWLDAGLRGLSAITAPACGEHFDRETARTVADAGFADVSNDRLGLGVFHLIAARKSVL
ncbi:MAG: class I SAM-dependent methyltransferase [Candidatus Sericytochromatia bacterium]|uniref:Class I SAM-dependent methyltransferase n=1 Tax=Candidatus Tanganyikabacteria bacterium TaxID=2961651 RepID=A0A938BHV1_9BACT|nr:class I SAM-dependent methyltransferase [Candidatus Tanganyikabacteria bacterium]